MGCGCGVATLPFANNKRSMPEYHNYIPENGILSGEGRLSPRIDNKLRVDWKSPAVSQRNTGGWSSPVVSPATRSWTNSNGILEQRRSSASSIDRESSPLDQLWGDSNARQSYHEEGHLSTFVSEEPRDSMDVGDVEELFNSPARRKSPDARKKSPAASKNSDVTIEDNIFDMICTKRAPVTNMHPGLHLTKILLNPTSRQPQQVHMVQAKHNLYTVCEEDAGDISPSIQRLGDSNDDDRPTRPPRPSIDISEGLLNPPAGRRSRGSRKRGNTPPKYEPSQTPPSQQHTPPSQQNHTPHDYHHTPSYSRGKSTSPEAYFTPVAAGGSKQRCLPELTADNFSASSLTSNESSIKSTGKLRYFGWVPQTPEHSMSVASVYSHHSDVVSEKCTSPPAFPSIHTSSQTLLHQPTTKSSPPSIHRRCLPAGLALEIKHRAATSSHKHLRPGLYKRKSVNINDLKDPEISSPKEALHSSLTTSRDGTKMDETALSIVNESRTAVL